MFEHRMKKTVYVIIALTHVKTEEQRQLVRDILRWLEEKFDVEILTWAFDVEAWQPKPVENVYEFDRRLALWADLAIVFFLNGEGSDGRGGEIFLRVEYKKPIIAFAIPGTSISTFSRHALEKSASQPIHPFVDFEGIYSIVAEALERVDVSDDMLGEQLTLDMAHA